MCYTDATCMKMNVHMRIPIMCVKRRVCVRERGIMGTIILIHISYLKLLLLEYSIDLYIIIYTKKIRIKKVYMFIVLKSMCFGDKGIECHFQQYFSYIVVVRWRKLENAEKTFDLLQVTDKFCPFKVVWRLQGVVENLTR
jgi:hypothetical protein